MALSPLVGVWFQVHYPPLIGVLPIFRSRYWCAIGRQGVLSLGRWASRIQAYFHVLGPTQVPDRPVCHSPTGLSPAMVEHSRTVRLGSLVHGSGPTTPRGDSAWFGLVRVRSPLLTESRFLSLPPGTEMFQFPGLAAMPYAFRHGWFGHPGINARAQLRRAFRSVPRPSSPPGAKTSPIRS